ncbi:MAG: tetratricopeptide repeat protein [Phycisphaerae bacterium]|nr:tetratricopeptide repeat protein [Phycisphaerae bacterium]
MIGKDGLLSGDVPDDNDAGPHDRQWEAHYLLYVDGRAAIDAGEFEQAIELLTQSLRLHPHAKTLELLGECHLKLGRPFEALMHAAASVGMQTVGVRNRLILARALVELSHFDAAKETLREALLKKPDFKTAAIFLAQLERAHPCELDEQRSEKVWQNVLKREWREI